MPASRVSRPRNRLTRFPVTVPWLNRYIHRGDEEVGQSGGPQGALPSARGQPEGARVCRAVRCGRGSPADFLGRRRRRLWGAFWWATLHVFARACCDRLRSPTLTWAHLLRSGHAAEAALRSPAVCQGEIEEEIDGCDGASASPLPSPPREVEVLAACD